MSDVDEDVQRKFNFSETYNKIEFDSTFYESAPVGKSVQITC